MSNGPPFPRVCFRQSTGESRVPLAAMVGRNSLVLFVESGPHAGDSIVATIVLNYESGGGSRLVGESSISNRPFPEVLFSRAPSDHNGTVSVPPDNHVSIGEQEEEFGTGILLFPNAYDEMGYSGTWALKWNDSRKGTFVYDRGRFCAIK